MDVIILGAGRIGVAMAHDLSRDDAAKVTVADVDPAALERVESIAPVDTVEGDLSDPQTVAELVSDHEFAINAMPGFLGYQTLEAILTAGRDVVDIAFFPENPFGLDELAKAKGVTAVVDMGVSPGMSGVLVGHAAAALDEVDDVTVYVGGLPAEPEWPWEYKAVFSPIDVIEEYTRPARLITGGKRVTHDALSDVELLEFDGVGTLEAFNTDGLRTLLDTIPAANMVEKTLRYPGHAEKMRMLRDSGFFGQKPVEVGGLGVRPIDLTTNLLFSQWQLAEGEADVTVMRVEVEGRREGRRTRHAYDMIDRYDPKTGMTSMARTTGYTATTVARLVRQGGFDRHGISPPEYLGASSSCVNFLLDGLAARGIVYRESIETIA